MITQRQRQILELLARSARRGASLSIRDIGDQLGLRSPATVYQHLRVLARHGLVERAGRSRRYRPVARVVRNPGIPIAGVIQAGAPIESEEGPLGELAIDPESLTLRGDIVALKVKGDSMINAGIFDGDYVIIRRQPRVENGEIAAVLVNGAGTLKRVHVGRKRVELRPDNARFQAIALTRAVVVAGLDRRPQHASRAGHVLGESLECPADTIVVGVTEPLELTSRRT